MIFLYVARSSYDYFHIYKRTIFAKLTLNYLLTSIIIFVKYINAIIIIIVQSGIQWDTDAVR